MFEDLGIHLHHGIWRLILQFPLPGTKVVRRHKGKQETRWVLDRTLGGQVVYISGRWSRHVVYGERCTLEEWHEWAGTTNLDEREPLTDITGCDY